MHLCLGPDGPRAGEFPDTSDNFGTKVDWVERKGGQTSSFAFHRGAAHIWGHLRGAVKLAGHDFVFPVNAGA